jgi:hypothetical protein
VLAEVDGRALAHLRWRIVTSGGTARAVGEILVGNQVLDVHESVLVIDVTNRGTEQTEYPIEVKKSIDCAELVERLLDSGPFVGVPDPSGGYALEHRSEISGSIYNTTVYESTTDAFTLDAAAGVCRRRIVRYLDTSS